MGGAHSALANWLFARSTGGRFLLRIEDTDVERNRPELVDGVLAMLRWLGLEWDEEPVHQSERFGFYAEAADRLADAGAAYACDCSAEDVRGRNAERGGKPGYDGHCRGRGLAPGPSRALRFRTPDEGSTAWADLVRGTVTFEHANLEDFVLLRSDGTPTFLLANVVDDAAMAISHVIRGEDHVNGTPKYLLIRAALDLGPPPVFAHMPLLVNESRKKLSKRRDDVSVADYQLRGFLPEAMRNYLALLGWGPDDGVEVRPIEEIIERYRLEDVNPAPAFFDIKKLTHVNAEWIRRLSPAAFISAAAPFLPAGDAPRRSLEALAEEVRDRVRTLDEVPAMIDFLWLDEPEIDEASWDKAVVRGRNAGAMLDAAIDGLAALDDWSSSTIRAAVEKAAIAAGLVNAEGGPQLAKAQGPVRVAVTGRSVGPPLFELLSQLGRERTLQRLRAARVRLG